MVELESAGLPRIETLEILKKDLKSQFLPTNSSLVTRDGLRRLWHSVGVCQGILVLDIECK